MPDSDLRSSVRAVIAELHINPEVVITQLCDYLLQSVAVFASDAHQVALNRSLDFELGVLDELDDPLGLLLRNALLQADALPHGAARRLLNLAVSQSFQRHTALNELRLQNVIQAFEPISIL